jgi:2-amino-4-hydroxy-6-hydroxymethyldihydropteridine diphosphokinase
MNRVVVGVGSNIEPARWIPAARRIVARDLRLVAESRFVSTKPLGRTDQPDFVNGAWLVETEHDRASLKAYFRGVEARLGRDRSDGKYGPRTIDLDIVAWNGDVVDADYHRRDFVRAAAREVCPELPGDEPETGTPPGGKTVTG